MRKTNQKCWYYKRKFDHFDPLNIFLTVATNMPVLLMTGFVVQARVTYTRYLLFMLALQVFSWTIFTILLVYKLGY